MREHFEERKKMLYITCLFLLQKRKKKSEQIICNKIILMQTNADAFFVRDTLNRTASAYRLLVKQFVISGVVQVKFAQGSICQTRQDLSAHKHHANKKEKNNTTKES